MSKLARTLTVIRKERLTPNMLRITLCGESLATFPENVEGGYIKLCFDQQGRPLAGLLDDKPVMRSYSIRAFDAVAQAIIIDCVDHTTHCDGHGPASQWIQTAVVGDRIVTNGPGMVQRVDTSGDCVLLAGDMTALPAIATNLERLPTDAKGCAIIEILNQDDKQALTKPEAVELVWVVNAKPDRPNTLLADAVKQLTWPERNKVGVWFAGEFASMRNLRRYFKEEKNVFSEALYISSYWKMGETDEGNKRAKKLDAAISV